MGKVSPSSPSDFIRVKDSCKTAKVKRGHTNIDFFFMIGSVGGAFDQLSMKYVFGEAATLHNELIAILEIFIKFCGGVHRS